MDRLEELLRTQAELYRTLVSASSALGDAVQRRDAGAVSEVAARQARIAADLCTVMAECRRAVADAARSLGLPDQAQLSDVVQKLGASDDPVRAQRLRQSAGALRRSVDEARRLTAQNAALLRQALAYTSFALRALTAAGAAPRIYTGTGAAQLSVRPLVDTHA